jgi:hypothetical protein
MHLKANSVPDLKVGDRVNPGDLIGTLGNTGRSSGPHLHWQIDDGPNTPINPAPYLEGKSAISGLSGHTDGTSSSGSYSSSDYSSSFSSDGTSSAMAAAFNLPGLDASKEEINDMLMQNVSLDGDGKLDLANAFKMAKNAATGISGQFGKLFGLSSSSGSAPGGSSFSSSYDNAISSSFQSTGGDNVAYVYNFLTMRGLSPASACGILGNLYQESGVEFDKQQSNGTGPAYGICQWENCKTNSGRYANMVEFARKRGRERHDPESQLLSMWEELTGNDINQRMKGKHATGSYYAGIANDLEQALTGPAKGNGEMVGGHGLPGGFNEFKALTDVKLATSIFEGAFERAGKPIMATRWAKAQEYYERFTRESQSKVGPQQYNQQLEDMGLREGGPDGPFIPGVGQGGIGGDDSSMGSLQGRRSSSIASGKSKAASAAKSHKPLQPDPAFAARIAKIGSKTSRFGRGGPIGDYPDHGTLFDDLPGHDQVDLATLEATLAACLIELQAISGNTEDANDYLDDINKKDFGGGLGGTAEQNRQINRALKKQRPRGTNPFPYNHQNITSVMAIAKPH